MDAALGHPTTDPHGEPIPSKEGQIDRSRYNRLADLEPGDVATVRQVPSDDPALLQYLGRLGLVPNVQVQVIDKAPFGGPLTLQIGDARQTVGRELADQPLAAVRMAAAGPRRPRPAVDPAAPMRAESHSRSSGTRRPKPQEAAMTTMVLVPPLSAAASSARLAPIA